MDSYLLCQDCLLVNSSCNTHCSRCGARFSKLEQQFTLIPTPTQTHVGETQIHTLLDINREEYGNVSIFSLIPKSVLVTPNNGNIISEKLNNSSVNIPNKITLRIQTMIKFSQCFLKKTQTKRYHVSNNYEKSYFVNVTIVCSFPLLET